MTQKALLILLLSVSLLLPACDGDDTSNDTDAAGDTGGACADCRVTEGLLAHYPMTAGGGAQLLDLSGKAPPLILQILGTGAGVTEWLTDRNGIVVQSENKILVAAARKLGTAIQASGAFSFEIWFSPSSTALTSAWIAGYSLAETDRNITLVQDGTALAVWLRTSNTDDSGLLGGQPPLSVPDIAVQGENHVVVTFENGTLNLYHNGVLAGSAAPGGDLSNWVTGHTFILANEVTGNHAWTGEYYQIAWYEKALTLEEVALNFSAGSVVVPAAP